MIAVFSAYASEVPPVAEGAVVSDKPNQHFLLQLPAEEVWESDSSSPC